MTRFSAASEASFTLLTESSRLEAGWNLSLVVAAAGALHFAGLPWPLRAYLFTALLCLVGHRPPASCGLLSIDRHGWLTLAADGAFIAGPLRAARISGQWIEFRLAGARACPVIWRDQVSASGWSALCRWLRVVLAT